MTTEFLVVTLVVGIGTWLFRFLPTRLRSLSSARGDRGRRGQARDGAARAGRLTQALESIGPAAIATLFIASVLPGLATAAQDRILVLVGCATTVLIFVARRNIVLATLAGAVAYGVAYKVLGVDPL